MPFTLSNRTTEFTKEMESFFLYYDFVVGQNNEKVTVRDGYFAVYFSQKSGPPRVTKPAGVNQDYNILDESNNTLALRHLDLVESRLVDYSNEFSQLHLFKFDNGAASRPEWYAEGGWNVAFKNPDNNEDGHLFWDHTLDVAEASLSKRYVYSLMTRENASGTRSLGLVMPLLKPSLFAAVLGLHKSKGKAMPEISLKPRDLKPWSYFPKNVTNLPGSVQGYVMIAQGAFKAIPLSSAIEDWHFDSKSTSSTDIASRLAKVVHEAHGYKHTLEEAGNTERNSVIGASARGPVEVLFLDSLNKTNAVASVLP